jgi:hypothetical protein
MRTLTGGHPSVGYYQKDASESTAFYVGDVVNREADQYLADGGTPGTTTYQGVNLVFGAASTLTDHLVMDSPDALFEAQDDDATTGLVLADMGLNANLIFGAGSAYTQLSGHEIDQDTKNTTNTLDVHLLRILDAPDNAAGSHCRVEIVFNKHRLLPGVAGV